MGIEQIQPIPPIPPELPRKEPDQNKKENEQQSEKENSAPTGINERIAKERQKIQEKGNQSEGSREWIA